MDFLLNLGFGVLFFITESTPTTGAGKGSSFLTAVVSLTAFLFPLLNSLLLPLLLVCCVGKDLRAGWGVGRADEPRIFKGDDREVPDINRESNIGGEQVVRRGRRERKVGREEGDGLTDSLGKG